MNEAAVKRLVAGLPPCSTHTGAYCQARQRLPVDMVSTLVLHTGEWMAERAAESWCWRGRPVRLVDGTTVVMPDTPANQSAYPQPRSQKPGLRFPLCRRVGIICLGTGAVLNAAIGSFMARAAAPQNTRSAAGKNGECTAQIIVSSTPVPC